MVYLLGAIVLGAVLVGAFAYCNLHYDYGNDRFLVTKGKAAGFAEKTYRTSDGHEIAYLEGPANGAALLLIHGQTGSKEDYARVLPELARSFHVFAVDCYGHGRSSKDPARYKLVSMRDDFLHFVDEVIGERVMLSGHSSGALIAAAMAAAGEGRVRGLLLEDGPFFTTERGRAEKTLAYLEFRLMHDFLRQDEETNYTRYYLRHTYMKEIFDEGGKNVWVSAVEKPYGKRIREGSDKMPMLWYLPPAARLNELVFRTRNREDGTGAYDLRFGETFYDFSWFDGFDTESALRAIDCPTVILHVAPPRKIAPSYVDRNGILLSAMDDEDAERVHECIRGSVLRSGYACDHNIHADLPKSFIESVFELMTLAQENAQNGSVKQSKGPTVRAATTSGYMTGLSLGFLGGTAVGIALGDVGMGAMVGLAAGLLIGNAYDARKNAEKAKRDAVKPEGTEENSATEQGADEKAICDERETKGDWR